ncbi:hypothetical protein BgiBS90_021688, partial [Biomphalaria glabrata]
NITYGSCLVDIIAGVKAGELIYLSTSQVLMNKDIKRVVKHSAVKRVVKHRAETATSLQITKT